MIIHMCLSFPDCRWMLVCSCDSACCLLPTIGMRDKQQLQFDVTGLLQGDVLSLPLVIRHDCISMRYELHFFQSTKCAGLSKWQWRLCLWDLQGSPSCYLQQFTCCQNPLSHILGSHDPQVIYIVLC